MESPKDRRTSLGKRLREIFTNPPPPTDDDGHQLRHEAGLGGTILRAVPEAGDTGTSFTVFHARKYEKTDSSRFQYSPIRHTPQTPPDSPVGYSWSTPSPKRSTVDSYFVRPPFMHTAASSVYGESITTVSSSGWRPPSPPETPVPPIPHVYSLPPTSAPAQLPQAQLSAVSLVSTRSHGRASSAPSFVSIPRTPPPVPPKSQWRSTRAMLPIAPADIILNILDSLSSLSDLAAFTSTCSRVRSLYLPNKASILRNVVRNSNFAAGLLLDILEPVSERPSFSSLISTYRSHQFTVQSLITKIQSTCVSFLPANLTTQRLELALYRIWAFSLVFAAPLAVEAKDVSDTDLQSTWLLTWIKQKSDLEDMLEAWSCLNVLLRPIISRPELAATHGAISHATLEDRNKCLPRLEIFLVFLQSRGLEAVLELAGPAGMGVSSNRNWQNDGDEQILQAAWGTLLNNGWEQFGTREERKAFEGFVKKGVSRAYATLCQQEREVREASKPPTPTKPLNNGWGLGLRLDRTSSTIAPTPAITSNMSYSISTPVVATILPDPTPTRQFAPSNYAIITPPPSPPTQNSVPRFQLVPPSTSPSVSTARNDSPTIPQLLLREKESTELALQYSYYPPEQIALTPMISSPSSASSYSASSEEGRYPSSHSSFGSPNDPHEIDVLTKWDGPGVDTASSIGSMRIVNKDVEKDLMRELGVGLTEAVRGRQAGERLSVLDLYDY